jgi:Family of unknown function (DUF6325)
MSNDVDEMGPIDHLVVEVPDNRMTGEGFPLLVDLVDRGPIRVLDLAFFTKANDGSVAGVNLAELDNGQFDMTVLEGASSGLIGQDDINEASSIIEPGSLVYEPSVLPARADHGVHGEAPSRRIRPSVKRRLASLGICTPGARLAIDRRPAA